MSSTSISTSPSAHSRSGLRHAGQVPCTPRRDRAHARNRSTSIIDLSDSTPRLARPACPENSLPKEVFETRFENPFKALGRGFGQKQERTAAASSAHDASFLAQRQSLESSPRKSVNLRVMLSSLRLTFTPIRPDDSSAISPGPSISSQSTDTSTDSSVSSSSGTQDCIRNGVRRTDPYGPPYFARAPIGATVLRSRRSRASSLSSIGPGSRSLASSVAPSASGVSGRAAEVSPSESGTLSAAAAIADAARKGRLRDALDVGCDRKH